MNTLKSWSATMMALPLAFAVACSGGEPDRSALAQDEIDRQLDLALAGDTVTATFEDTAFAADPAPMPGTPPLKPAPTPTPPRASRPQPAPVTPQPAPAPPEPEIVTRSVPVGTTMQLVLNEALSTGTSMPGDAFTATLTVPVLDAAGNVVVPAGAILRGRVTQVEKSGRVGETAVLSLAFEGLSFDDESYPIEASVVSANPERVTRQSTSEQVGKVAVGAAAGAILGRVLGKDTRSTVKGAVIGAAAGTAIAMGTADVDAVLRAGSAMVIRMDIPLVITKTVM